MELNNNLTPKQTEEPTNMEPTNMTVLGTTPQ